jgi:uncharacterized protein YhhL (DUF1145 family)
VTNTGLILVLKLLVLGTWFVAAAGFLFPVDTGFGRAGRALFALLAVIHAVECAAFYRTLARTGRPLALELFSTFFFGIAHFVEARALADAAPPDGPDAAQDEDR